MKAFLKSFLVTFVLSASILSGVFWGIGKFIEHSGTSNTSDDTGLKGAEAEKNIVLDEYIKQKKRVNILVVGIDGGRSDTIMLVSMGLHDQSIKVMSIPRDTYHPLKGIDGYEAKKINAIYGIKGDKGGADGLRRELERFLGIEIPFFVESDYNAVREIVNVLGGVEYEVPFNMNYDDPYAKPELHIHLKKGKQVLDGDKTLQFLRWRKNNGEEGLGDIERIKRQQAFLTAAAKKAVSLKLPMVIKTAFDNVKTNMGVSEMLYTGTKMLGTDFGAIEKDTLPGQADMKNGVSYFIVDQDQLKSAMDQLLSSKVPEPATPPAQ